MKDSRKRLGSLKRDIIRSPTSHNDELDHYQREHRGAVDDWVGLYEPADEGSGDPEAMGNWRISYIIEKI